jgi:hypothetical protein
LATEGVVGADIAIGDGERLTIGIKASLINGECGEKKQSGVGVSPWGKLLYPLLQLLTRD